MYESALLMKAQSFLQCMSLHCCLLLCHGKRTKSIASQTSLLGSDDPDELTLPEQTRMVLGINQFRHLYENVPVSVNHDRNASAVADGGGLAASQTVYDKMLKDCFFQKTTSGGKLSIYAHKPDGITKSLLTSKDLTNPVDVSILTSYAERC